MEQYEMKANLKSTLIIAGALLTGIAIGFEISEISIKREFEKMDSFRETKGFVKIFNDIIKPSQRQKSLVDSILIFYHNKVDSVSVANMDMVSSIMDTMNVELGKVINDEQKRKLTGEMQRMKNHPPPPPPDSH
jgi:hypothetical protein